MFQQTPSRREASEGGAMPSPGRDVRPPGLEAPGRPSGAGRRLATLATVMFAAGGVLPACGSSHSGQTAQPGVTVTMGSSMKLAGPSRWRPGSIRITAVSAGGEQELTLLRFHPGYGYADFLADGSAANGQGPGAAAAMQRVFANTEFLGGANVFAGEPASFTVAVTDGVYYLGEMNQNPTFRRIEVSRARAGLASPPAAGVTTSDSGFRLNQATLPAHGTIAIRNTGRQIHRLLLVPVKAGTTAAQVGAYLRQTGGQPDGPPPPFARSGPQVGTSMISPGQQLDFSYQLPAGTYAMLCFQPDSRTGQPQTLEGMYGVATLR